MMETKTIYRKPIGNPARKYRQDNFVISTFNAYTKKLRHGVELCKDLGFDMVEFAWATPENSYKCITACEEVGIDCMIQNWDIFGGFQSDEGGRELDLEKVKEYVEYIRKYKHVVGYYIWDEPYIDNTIRAAADQVNLFEELAPDKIPFTVAIPSYNLKWTWENGLFEPYLYKYTEWINPPVLSLDYYPFKVRHLGKPQQLDDSNIYLDLALMRKICLEKNIPMWFYFQTHDDPMTYGYRKYTPEMMRSQMYLALLYGTVGLQNYNVFNGAIYQETTEPGPLYFATKEMNHRCHQLGKTLMALTSVGVYHSPEVLANMPAFDAYRQPVSDSNILEDQKLPFRCSAGEFVDAEGNRYLMIQNRDHVDKRDFKLKLKKKFRIYEVSYVDGMQSVRNNRTQILTVSLQPGDAVLLRFQDANERPFLIDYVLEK